MTDNLKKEIEIQIKNIEKTILWLEKDMNSEIPLEAKLPAIGHLLQNIYMGIENILTRILKSENIKIVKDESWHKEIVKKSLEIGIFHQDFEKQVREYLKFRHRAIHGYGIELNPNLLYPLAEEIDTFWKKLKKSLLNYIEK